MDFSLSLNSEYITVIQSLVFILLLNLEMEI